MKILIIVAILMLGLSACCRADEAAPAATPADTDKPPAAQTTTDKPPAAEKPPEKPAQKPAPKPKPKKTLRTEAEISGLTSETTDQFYTRLNLRQTRAPGTWYLRAGYALTKTRTYSGANINETQIDTYSLDGQYRSDLRGDYRFISATVHLRDRSPYSPTYGDRSGYYMISTGVGRRVAPGLEAEIAIASVATYDDVIDRKITPVSSLRWTNDLTDAMKLTGHAYLVQPMADDMLVDSRMDLTYKFTPQLSMRFTYVANNLLKPIRSRTGWDKSFRVSLVFSG